MMNHSSNKLQPKITLDASTDFDTGVNDDIILTAPEYEQQIKVVPPKPHIKHNSVELFQ